MTRMRPKYKQMAFETAIRNPERYKEILYVVLKYDGIILNDENLLTIVCDMYLQHVVSGGGLQINENDTIDSIKSDVIRINSTRKRDGGFPMGYPSRFWTYMRTLSELGFVYARYNKKFIVSDVAKKLVKNVIDEQEAFSIQSMKYNRKSPYRNVLNDFNYFKFILKVLIELNKEGRKLSYYQFVVSLFSKDGNVKEFLNIINNHRFTDKINTYEYLKENYDNLTKINTVTKDYPDVVLRLLIITGFVSVEYNGIVMIGLNTSYLDYINKLLDYDFTLTEEEKNVDLAHYNKLSVLSDKEMEIIKSNRTESDVLENYNNVIKRIVDTYNLKMDDIISNINNVAYSIGNQDSRFRYIPDPLKLEFFISLFLHSVYGDELSIKPNYKVDSNGMPISHAPGNVGDIELFNKDMYWLVEVTLIRSRIQQLNNETLNLFRHLPEREIGKKYLSLVAPYVHTDTENLFNSGIINQILLVGYLNDFYSKAFKVSDFIDSVKDKNVLSVMENHTRDLLKELETRLRNNTETT